MKAAEQTIESCMDREVGRIRLNRPAVLNALNYELVVELERAVRKLETRVRVILIEAAGDHFCAGADLRLISETGEMQSLIEQINRAFFALERAPVPVIAAVQGYALAGGFELLQACDIVIVAEDAVLGDQHANFGLIPGGGGSQRLPRLVGRQRALALLLSGERLSGKEAVAWGLAYRCVPVSQLQEYSLSLALRLASKSKDGLTQMKQLVDRGWGKPLDDAIGMEVTAFLKWIRQDDAQEGLRAFREKRAPNFNPPRA